MEKAHADRGAIPADKLLGTIDDARDTYRGFGETAVRNMEEAGIPVPHRPRLAEDHEGIYADIEIGQYFDGRMPMVVKTLSLTQISALYALFMNWYAYVSAQEKEWKAKTSESLKLNKHIEAACRRMHTTDQHGEKRSDLLARVLAKLDMDFMEAERNLEVTKATHDMIEAQLKVANKNLAMISREITLRGMLIESQASHRGFNSRYGRALQKEDDAIVGSFSEDGGGEDEPQQERRTVGAPAKAQGGGGRFRPRGTRGPRAGGPG